MQAIASSAREQSTGLAEINSAINQLDQTTQQNAAMVEQSTAASVSLTQETDRLRNLVCKFRLSGRTSQQTASGYAHGADDKPASRQSTHQSYAAARPRAVGNAALKTDDWQEF